MPEKVLPTCFSRKNIRRRINRGVFALKSAPINAPRPDRGSIAANRISRRGFLALVGALGIGHGLTAQSSQGKTMQQLPQRTLGRIKARTSIIGLGGDHLGRASEGDAIAMVRKAIDEGITFMDNSWGYGGGKCETWMGKALRDGYREKVFLMTKIDGRDRKKAAEEIDDCLRRLQTDRIDLMQVHHIHKMSEPDQVFGPGGAMEALFEAKQAGKIKYIGFTGHYDPVMHLKMLNTGFANDFTFDAVQMPVNVMDVHFKSFEKEVLPVLVKHNIAVLAMKPLGGGMILRSGVVTATECLQYAMSLPVAVVITGCQNMRDLDQAVNAARTFQPYSANRLAELRNRTLKLAGNGKYEIYK